MDQKEEILNALASILSNTNASESNNRARKIHPQVKVVSNELGLRVRPYESNEELGYVQVQELTIANSSLTWKKRQKRTALVKGDVETLKEWLASFKSNILPGKVVILEFKESEIPEDIAKEFFPNEDNIRYDEIYESAVKRAGNDGVELLADGERIFSFKVYDEYDEMEDILLKHDNTEEVRQAARERRMKALEEAQKKAEAQAKKAKEELEKAASEVENSDEDEDASEKDEVKAKLD